MNEVTELPDGSLTCSCGAKGQAKNRARFHRRHPGECSAAQKAKDKKKEFSKKLASGVRCLPSEDPREGSLEPSRIEELLDEVLRSGIELTEWEEKFLESIQEQFERLGKLTVKQVEILEQLAGRRD